MKKFAYYNSLYRKRTAPAPKAETAAEPYAKKPSGLKGESPYVMLMKQHEMLVKSVTDNKGEK